MFDLAFGRYDVPNFERFRRRFLSNLSTYCRSNVEFLAWIIFKICFLEMNFKTRLNDSEFCKIQFLSIFMIAETNFDLYSKTAKKRFDEIIHNTLWEEILYFKWFLKSNEPMWLDWESVKSKLCIFFFTSENGSYLIRNDALDISRESVGS